MQIQNVLLRKQVQNLQQQKAFLKLKLNMLESKYHPTDITLINKQLYLNYMEEVLSYKEKNLVQMEEQLKKKQIQLIMHESHTKLLSPLEKSTEIDIFLKKIEQVKKIICNYTSTQSQQFENHQWSQFYKNETKILKECKEYQKQTEDLIKAEYQNMIIQRKQLTESMDKFQELNAYEMYLNQLQKALEAKEESILRKENSLQKIQNVYENSMTNMGSLSFGNQHSSIKQTSQKKRVKIFESVKKSEMKKTLPQYHSGISQGTKNYNSRYEQSSFIMQQAQNNQSETLKRQHYKTHVQGCEVSVQVSIETLPQSIQRLEKQRKILKFTKLWLKYSLNSNRNTTMASKKTFGLYLWRLNTLYDPSIVEKANCKNFSWPGKFEQSLKTKQLFPYNELSLKRQKYAQLTFDSQRKLFHRQKIQNILKNILKNKARKQRLVFAFYFKKLANQVKLEKIQHYSQNLPLIKGPVQQVTTHPPTSQGISQSRVISVNSSRIMNEIKPVHHETKQFSKQVSKGGKISSNTRTMSTSNLNHTKPELKQSKLNKENLSNEAIDLKKLKQYIKTQQQTQKALASQCVKTQAICHLSQALAGRYNKSLMWSFWTLKQNQDKQKMYELQKRINGYEFKWQLFMTKCKLALVSNSNKIGHLQQSLSFMLGK